MSHDEFDYQDALRRHGLRLQLVGLDDVLEVASRQSQVVARLVGLGRLDGEPDVLVVPNDPEAIRDLTSALNAVAGSESVGGLVRVRARGLLRELNKQAGTPEETPKVQACAVDDPKVTAEELAQARLDVGSPKLSVDRPDGLLYVAYGLGVDSTAILVGLEQLVREGRRDFRPDYIVLADTGAERQSTYDYLDVINPWLDKVGFPRVQVVAYATEFAAKSFGSSRTLEQQVLLTQQLPSISASKFRSATCSMLWKQAAQQKWLEIESGLFDQVGHRSYRPKPGLKIVKAIGYDADETDRERRGTFRVDDDKRLFKERGIENPFAYWYPLMSWGWTRARCIAEIEAAIGVVPPKSSCTFCGASKRFEVAALSKDELLRALLVEQLALNGWHAAEYASHNNKGLGVNFSWTELALEEGLITNREHAALMKKVFELAALPQDRGELNLADHPVIRRLPAFRDVRGLRGEPGTWDRFDLIPDDKKARA